MADNMENQDRRQGDRRQSGDRRKPHITITVNTFIFSLVIAVIVILAGVFFIVKSIQNSYEDDSLYYEDYDYNPEEDIDLEDEDIDGTLDNETENQNATDNENTTNTANETSAQ